MSLPRDLVVRLTPALLRRGDLAVARALDPRRGDVGALRRAFACAGAERRFAWRLLERRTNLWLFRTHQRAACGDFVIVDVSPPRVEARAALVLELKRGEPVREVGPTRLQVRNARAALLELARLGVIGAEAEATTLLGDADALMATLV
jgi:hypothetical protein